MACFGTCMTTFGLLLLLFASSAPSPLFLREGAKCLEGAAAGTCRRVRHCQSAVRAVHELRELPQRCGFVGREEVVCCPDAQSDVTGRDVDTSDFTNNARGRGMNRTSNEIPTGDDWAWPADVRRSVLECNSYKDQRNGPADYVIAGTKADQHEFPHMAALGYNVPNTQGMSWLCGGTLISDQFVLTAAHCCASRITGRPLRVRLGVNNLKENAEDSVYGISAIMMHSGYRKRQHYSDIALLKLDRKVEFTDAVFPACLHTQDGVPPNFTAAGWGATNTAGTRLSSELMKTTIHSFLLSNCQQTYKDKFPRGVDSSVICAGDPQGKTDTCVGDSGGPLVTGKDAPYTVIGITSLGPKPCGGTVPSIYTRVSQYLDWIEERVWS